MEEELRNQVDKLGLLKKKRKRESDNVKCECSEPVIQYLEFVNNRPDFKFFLY